MLQEQCPDNSRMLSGWLRNNQKSDINSFEQEFIHRLTELRYQKNVSAREMSLSIGQNAGYIHNIESGKALPSLSSFFYICEYLDITPKEFFDTETKNPLVTNEMTSYINGIDNGLTPHICEILKYLYNSNNSK